MRRITLGILSFFWLSFACFANDTIALKPGAQTEFNSKEKTIIRAAMGNPSIATLDVLSKNKLLISGQAIGETTLLLWYRNQSEP
ncbi:pilus assembly protein N-terminal domain-containing protein, partial [Vibrio sp. V39_P1S14PM300]|uniref:pilus assembly protein N-terminal domain-containing protein n=1 Tax=Vibrio sp. V39_P1S14PM300 TaxID=1938690 RepID=UPI001410A36A